MLTSCEISEGWQRRWKAKRVGRGDKCKDGWRRDRIGRRRKRWLPKEGEERGRWKASLGMGEKGEGKGVCEMRQETNRPNNKAVFRQRQKNHPITCSFFFASFCIQHVSRGSDEEREMERGRERERGGRETLLGDRAYILNFNKIKGGREWVRGTEVAVSNM